MLEVDVQYLGDIMHRTTRPLFNDYRACVGSVSGSEEEDSNRPISITADLEIFIRD